MAKSKFEYVKKFEFSNVHNFKKPNDKNALDLMNKCAECVMDNIYDVVLSYGQSDEYSFVLNKASNLYDRRESKIVSAIVSLFTSNYVFYWKNFFPDQELQYPPSFDGRIVQYPSDTNLRDYLSWRQADCHINNLYNTCYWALVHSGKTETEAELALRGTVSSQKNEMLFSQFNINYSKLPEMFRKGSVLFKEQVDVQGISSDGTEIKRRKKITKTYYIDIISDKFWKEHLEFDISI
ncbi:10917_t:CDS:2 [Paraglomus brasilianum]|uniref:tRNA(His) guanylyltransferase n=1 Tax=Paraglomus brasilianum TaxID=144538 RepID=A0A9N8W6D9_9GLOM|nr:10917_t:CDS:2 [Paraglomus brasilianum]